MRFITIITRTRLSSVFGTPSSRHGRRVAALGGRAGNRTTYCRRRRPYTRPNADSSTRVSTESRVTHRGTRRFRFYVPVRTRPSRESRLRVVRSAVVSRIWRGGRACAAFSFRWLTRRPICGARVQQYSIVIISAVDVCDRVVSSCYSFVRARVLPVWECVCARGAFSPLGPTDRGDARDVLYVQISLFRLRLVNRDVFLADDWCGGLFEFRLRLR